MRHLTILILCGLLVGCGKTDPSAPKQRYQLAMSKLNAAQTPEQKFYALGAAAKESFAAGKTADAQKYAEELLALLPDFRQSRDYGAAMCDANLVLGRVAVSKGNLEDAKRYLAAAAKSPTTPDMMNYGPNMGLAKDLLEKGEKQAVLDFFEQCKRLWPNGETQLDAWSQQVKDGKTPDFGSTLRN